MVDITEDAAIIAKIKAAISAEMGKTRPSEVPKEGAKYLRDRGISPSYEAWVSDEIAKAVLSVFKNMAFQFPTTVEQDILLIMQTYDEQMKSRGEISTPGGLEHMGDVWAQLIDWRNMILARMALAGKARGENG